MCKQQIAMQDIFTYIHKEKSQNSIYAKSKTFITVISSSLQN